MSGTRRTQSLRWSQNPWLFSHLYISLSAAGIFTLVGRGERRFCTRTQSVTEKGCPQFSLSATMCCATKKEESRSKGRNGLFKRPQHRSNHTCMNVSCTRIGLSHVCFIISSEKIKTGPQRKLAAGGASICRFLPVR